MNTVQFDPKITPDFQLDWRRPSNKDADPFADLLKRHFDADQRPRAPKRREEAADPLSGRPPRVVIAHERTLRGEAKRVEDADWRLPDQSSQSSAEGCAKEEETVPLEDGAAADAQTSEQDATGKVLADGETETADQAEPVAEGTTAVVEQATPVVVSVQAAVGECNGNGEAMLTATPVESTEGGPLPEPADQATTGTASASAATDPEATAEQQAIAAMTEAGLTEAMTALMTGQAAPATTAMPAQTVAQGPALPATPVQPQHPLLQMVQTPVPTIEPVPAAQPRAEHSSTDIKLRANTPPRAVPATPASPATGTPAQPAQPHATTVLQPTAASEFSSAVEPFDQAWSEGDHGQGWSLHLAQGAASKRPDFVAQLRQHLQNLPAHEQVAVHLQRAVREGTNKFSIQLSPAELGNIHVKLEIEDKRVTAAVTVERPSTLELLQRDTKGLERALHNAGLNMEGGDLSFSLGHGDQEFAQDLRHSGASAAGGTVLDGEADGGQPDNPVAQVMDTAAGIVNLQV
ncbi:MAG TPA: flagellar hook-length control protein FliK [Sphingomicrobium sp.]|nr:flagellar hook-length control protein FliK [Sphingomicrobium sp.]